MRAEEVKQNRAADTGQTRPYEVLLAGGVIHRVYLCDLLGREDLGPGARLTRLVVLDEPTLTAEAQHLIAEAPRQPGHDPLIDLIETILVYKFPKLPRAEIKAMLHLPVTDPKQTRYYQDAFQDGELALILRQLQRRFGPLEAPRRRQVEGLASADLDALGDALFDFGGLADLERWLDGRRGGE